uniref:Uncharacterized protein n=1 Tax=viral metagenome TaxID=1070528 RepID=A0A6C0E5I0_9ZZZZ
MENLKYNIYDFDGIKKMFVCGYKVENHEDQTFVSYLLFQKEEHLNFYEIDISDYCELNIKKIYALSRNILCKNINTISHVNYEGCLTDGDSLYVFYKLHDEYITEVTGTCLVLLDEIINRKHVCGSVINSSVVDFFLRNIKNVLYTNDYPIVAYKQIDPLIADYTCNLGVSLSEIDAIQGQFYYFTTYDNVQSSSFVRVVLFMGKQLTKQNILSDKTDGSYMKREKLSDRTNDTKYESLTNRITDYDGIWSEHYDSVYLGYIKLDNGQILKDTPCIVVKSFTQYKILSLHL